MDDKKSKGGAGQFLTFRLGDEEYAIDILKVQEIKGHTALTPLPNTPPFIKGVMNLRGAIVPVISLRERFSLGARPYDKLAVIIIVALGARVVGLLVDAVSDVIDLAQAEIEPAPELGASVDTSALTGLAKVSGKLVALLDVERAVGHASAAPN